MRKSSIFIFKDMRIALEKSTRKITPEGYLQVEAVVARTGIQEYRGYELPNDCGYDFEPDKVYRIYRSPKEIFSPETLNSFLQKPVTNEHPHDVGGLVNAETATQKLVGVSGSKVYREGEQFKVALTLYSANVINDVNQGKIGISAGYTGDIVMKPGIAPNGQPYDGIVINMRGNHIAICDLYAARGGTGCRILDRSDVVKNGIGQDPNSNAMGGTDGLPDLSDINQLGQMLQQLTSNIKDGFAALLTAIKGDDEETEDEPLIEGAVTDEDPDADDDKKSGAAKPASGKMTDAITQQMSRMQQEIAYLRGQLQVSKKSTLTDAHIQKVVSAKVALLKQAEQVLPGIDLSGLDSIEIKRRVIKAVMPDVILDSSAAFVDGAYQACIGSFINGSGNSFGLASAINDSYAQGGINSGGTFDEVDSGAMADQAYKNMQERRRKNFSGSKE